jgi:hypothetical protein
MARVTQVAVGGYWVNHYDNPCKQATTDYCDELVTGFTDAMKARGHRIDVLRSEHDASPLQWGAWTDKKPNGVDTIQFAFLATHGGTHGHELRGSIWLHWTLATFSSTDGCYVSTIRLDGRWFPVTPSTPVVTMRLGEGRLRWAVLDLCRSLQIGVVNERDQNARAELAEADPGTTWKRCFDGVHMLFGFTGLSSDAYWTQDRGKSFGQRAGRGELLADSWIDEAYSWWTDDAPVALACGRSDADATARLNSESLAAVAPPLNFPDATNFAYMWRA